jgi:hypothetical protein
MFAISHDLQHNADRTFAQVLNSSDKHLKDDFKSFLLKFSDEIKLFDELLQNIKHLDKEDTYSLYNYFRHLSSGFDELHQDYYDREYVHDQELKALLKSIGRQLHKLENVSHKYFAKFLPFEKTPDYIKSGLAQFSQEVLSKKLSQ